MSLLQLQCHEIPIEKDIYVFPRNICGAIPPLPPMRRERGIKICSEASHIRHLGCHAVMKSYPSWSSAIPAPEAVLCMVKKEIVWDLVHLFRHERLLLMMASKEERI